MDILDKIHVNSRLDMPLVVQIKEQLIWLIASGQLQPGDQLPGVRQAASRLGVNLHTVRNAYLRLASLGLVETRQGMSARVLTYDPQRFTSLSDHVPSHMIGVIVPNLENPLYTRYLRGVEQVARPEHTLLLVCDAHDEPEEAFLYFRKLAEKGVDGILVFSFGLSGFFPTEARGTGWIGSIPSVTVDWPEPDHYTVLCDFQDGAQQATTHLLENGHLRIGLITFSLDIPIVQQIQAGYLHSLSKAGIALDPELIAPVYGFDIPAGEEAARVLLGLPHPPTAIIAISDLMAVGALKAIREAGLRVPRDIGLVGFNDIPLAGLVDPPLTTVRQPAYEMGQRGMELLKDLIAGHLPELRRVILPTRLVVRQSSGDRVR